MKFWTILAKQTELGSNSSLTSLLNCTWSAPASVTTFSGTGVRKTLPNGRSKSRLNRDFTTGLEKAEPTGELKSTGCIFNGKGIISISIYLYIKPQLIYFNYNHCVIYSKYINSKYSSTNSKLYIIQIITRINKIKKQLTRESRRINTKIYRSIAKTDTYIILYVHKVETILIYERRKYKLYLYIIWFIILWGMEWEMTYKYS